MALNRRLSPKEMFFLKRPQHAHCSLSLSEKALRCLLLRNKLLPSHRLPARSHCPASPLSRVEHTLSSLPGIPWGPGFPAAPQCGPRGSRPDQSLNVAHAAPDQTRPRHTTSLMPSDTSRRSPCEGPAVVSAFVPTAASLAGDPEAEEPVMLQGRQTGSFASRWQMGKLSHRSRPPWV